MSHGLTAKNTGRNEISHLPHARHHRPWEVCRDESQEGQTGPFPVPPESLVVGRPSMLPTAGSTVWAPWAQTARARTSRMVLAGAWRRSPAADSVETLPAPTTAL